MPTLNTPDNRRQLAAALSRPGGTLVLTHVAPDQGQYAYAQPPGIEVCMAAVAAGQAAVVLVSADLEYRGPAPALQRLFRTAPIDGGWRPVGRLSPPTAGTVLRYVDALLGLDGQGARVDAWPPDSREVVVPAAQAPREGKGRHQDEAGFGQDLVQRARAGEIGEIVGREREVEALTRIALKLTKNAACLVGPPGVGKTAVVEAFALRIAQGRVPPSLREAHVLEVNLAFLAAGASYKNEFEGRFKALLDQARDDHRTILFLDEVHLLCAPTNDVSQMVKADLGRGRVRCIGATTTREWRTIEADAALARRFQVIPVAEPTPQQTVEILKTIRNRLAAHHGVTVDDALLAEAVELSLRYVPDRHLPDKAIDLLDEAAAWEALRALPAGGAEGQGSAPEQHARPHSGHQDPTPQDLDAAIQEAIARGDYARAYALDAIRRKGAHA